MSEEEMVHYIRLANAYDFSKTICDPIEYIFRQQRLLQAVTEFLLKPYEDELEKLSKERDGR